jgi:hypothetical protein
MFELKTVLMVGKGWIMWISIIYTAYQVVGYQRTVEKRVRNVACMGVKLTLNGFLIGKWEGKSLFRGHV